MAYKPGTRLRTVTMPKHRSDRIAIAAAKAGLSGDQWIADTLETALSEVGITEYEVLPERLRNL